MGEKIKKNKRQTKGKKMTPVSSISDSSSSSKEEDEEEEVEMDMERPVAECRRKTRA